MGHAKSPVAGWTTYMQSHTTEERNKVLWEEELWLQLRSRSMHDVLGHGSQHSHTGSGFRRWHVSGRSGVITIMSSKARHNDRDCAGVSIACCLGMPGVSAQRSQFRLCNCIKQLLSKVRFIQQQNFKIFPGQCGSASWVSSHSANGCRFQSQSGYMPRLQAPF